MNRAFLRVGLVADHFAGWQGGRDFFENIVHCMSATQVGRGEVRLLGEIWRDRSFWRMISYSRHILSQRSRSAQGRVRITDFINEVAHGLRMASVQAGSWNHPFSRQARADVVGPLMYPPHRGVVIPWIGYIPDCQHRFLPQFFTEDIRRQRDEVIRAVLGLSYRVIVNSKSTAVDLIGLYEAQEKRLVVLPYAMAPRPDWLELQPEAYLDQLALPRPYFACCNQFWVHKNHRVVIEALGLAARMGVKFNVVFTGATEDYRNPSHFADLVSLAEQLGVRSQCHFLGLVPKMTQIAVMKGSIAVIQPTLFEGGPGGGAGQEALALGLRVILSNLPINREFLTAEIPVQLLSFFEPLSSESLVVSMIALASVSAPTFSRLELVALGETRIDRAGRVLWDVFEMAGRSRGP